jgi:hypothetical protein
VILQNDQIKQMTRFTLLSTAAVAALCCLTTEAKLSEQAKKRFFGNAKTKTQRIEVAPMTFAEFTAIMEEGPRRALQDGFGNDPNACQSDGVRFSCNTFSTIESSDGNETLMETNVDCLLNDQIGMDFQQSEDCGCSTSLT